MSAAPGKVLIHGTTDLDGERAFVLSFLQARQADWVGRPFFAAYDEDAEWFDELKPTTTGTSFPPFARDGR